MRQIKYRAWDKELKKMMDWFYIHSEEGGVWEQDGMDKMIKLPEERFELMQFTGLKDSKGVEIYESDVVEACYCIDLEDHDEHTKHEVKWMGEHDYPAFDLEPEISDDANGFSYAEASNEAPSLEVIGNVWEHPSLITNKT